MTRITESRRSQFTTWAKEFETRYLLEPAGQRHLASYAAERESVAQYWNEAKSAKKAGKDITDLVLYKLLPYSNTRHNREMGYRISVAPAITKDIRKWFENAGWQSPENWPKVASAIYDLFYALVEQNDWTSLEKFERNETLSRGIRAGFITPTLHCLRPEFRILNSKTIDTISLLLDQQAIARDLTNYKRYLGIIDQALAELDIHLFRDRDVFDAFCHWMCDKRLGGYARLQDTETRDDETVEAPPAFEDEAEPQNHWEAIYYIVKCGSLLGYKTYVADPSRTAFGKKLSELATLSSVPPILSTAPEIARVDAIWYKPVPPFFLFEVEDGGTMREALHRLYNAMAFDARFFVVCPAHNREKFDKWVTTAPFKEFEARYEFRTYEELFAFYRATLAYTAMRSRFLRV